MVKCIICGTETGSCQDTCSPACWLNALHIEENFIWKGILTSPEKESSVACELARIVPIYDNFKL